MSAYTTKQIGDAGEEYAVEYLKKRKHKVISRNYRRNFGEIDIISQKGEYIVFTEVKTRRTDTMSQPIEAVNRQKRQRIVKTAAAFLAENNLDSFCRFDICEVYINPQNLKLKKINYLENAFDAGD